MPPDPSELLGKQVQVILQFEDEDREQVVVEGKLLVWGEFGEVRVQDEMGDIHHAWPMLEVREIASEKHQSK
jgi:hypothetical protein